MTRCSSPRGISVSDDNVERSRAVVARLKNSEWRRSRKSDDRERSSHLYASQRLLTNSLAETMTGEDEHSCQPGTAARLEEANQPGQTPVYDVFLGGSCGTTVWRRQLVIPFLKKRSISYYDPQRSVWSENMIYEESIAKENSSLFLFVIDPATVNATSFLEIAYFAARKSPKLIVVFLGKSEWAEKAHPDDIPDRNRTCQLLDRILDAHNVPMLYNIQDALDYIEEEVIGSKKWTDAIANPNQRLSYLSLRAKRLARGAQMRAKQAWNKIRCMAAGVSIAGIADALVLLSCHLLLPSLPLHAILLPLLLVNVLVVAVATKWAQLRSQRPRLIADSCGVAMGAQRRAAAIPSPRMSTVTSPLVPKGKSNAKASKNIFDQLGTDDGSNSFVVPQSFRKSVKSVDPPATVVLSCSSMEETNWVQSTAAPVMDRNKISYSWALASNSLLPEMRMNCLKAWSSQFKHFFYHIPSTKTFLSGMVEIAYMLGHTSWQVTVCVPKEAETLETPTNEEDESQRVARRRRNDCYQIAYCYLKDMAKRRQCKVFSELDEAVRYTTDMCLRGL